MKIVILDASTSTLYVREVREPKGSEDADDVACEAMEKLGASISCSEWMMSKKLIIDDDTR